MNCVDRDCEEIIIHLNKQ